MSLDVGVSPKQQTNKYINKPKTNKTKQTKNGKKQHLIFN
jgi:hypothetical protein